MANQKSAEDGGAVATVPALVPESLLHSFPVQRNVQAFALLFFRDA
jgi:hypothetical protein